MNRPALTMNRPAFAAPTPFARPAAGRTPSVCPRMVAEPKPASPKPANPPKAADPPVAPRDEHDEKVKFKPIRTVKSSASWAYTFVDTFGAKGPGSRPLWDLRPASHRNKGVVETLPCDFCEGTGVQVCSFCEGNPWYEDGKEVSCPACGGEHHVTCSTCFGTGKQIELTEGWWEKGVAALFGQN